MAYSKFNFSWPDGNGGTLIPGAFFEQLESFLVLLNSAVHFVEVVTGNESRPNVGMVLWVGGENQPQNMAVGDLWMQEGGVAPGDTTDPSAPTGLTTGTITDTSISLSWTAATDNVGVSGYEVSTDGTSWADVGDVLVHNFTALQPGTSYDLQARAYDAAGNRGPAATLTESTTGAGAAEHVIIEGVPPVLPDTFTDGTPTITTATGFYTTVAGAGFRCVGGKVYVPAGSGAIGKAIDVGLWQGAFTEEPQQAPDLSAAPLRSGTVATAVQGWNEVRWTPYVLPNTGLPGVYIGSNIGNDGTYLSVPSNETGFTSAFIPSPTAGTAIVMGEIEAQRSVFMIGTGSTTQTQARWYGQDIIVDEG